MLKTKDKDKIYRFIGILGTLLCLMLFIYRPSFPTPDKLIVFLFFVFMIFHQAKDMLLRIGPFVALMMVYESFRSIVPHLNSRVNYSLAPKVDQTLFRRLPTRTLQDWLWKGHTSWYDIALYIPYLLFFIIPLLFAIIVWKTKAGYYWQVVATYLVVFFGSFLTFLLFPAAPPWLAYQNNYIDPIVRISSNVWASLGIKDFPSLYSHIAANPVAAVPSLHAACATLLSIFAFKIYGRRWGAFSVIYPASIYLGVVYEGEHYVFDVMCGALYGVVGYLAVNFLFSSIKNKKTKKTLAKPKLKLAHYGQK
ncbi:MAG TPA: phosphatase PAP2 family protein [Candidatus Babeliales bacterium]|nr:phosphatase PAP2 family protein [Candidatus Babeliales bacterium]